MGGGREKIEFLRFSIKLLLKFCDSSSPPPLPDTA